MRFIVYTLSFLFVLSLQSSVSDAKLFDYVDEYRGVTVSESQLKKIARYDKYIKYFTSFSYFIPRHKVSPDFIRALILAESNADPRAISNKDALGLGQILYSTGKQAALELSKSQVRFDYVSKETLQNLKRSDLFKPAVNILITCYLIAKYNYKFDGKIELVLSAWNAGEYTSSLKKMQHAPFKETENLIGKVNGYYLYFIRRGY